MAKIPRITAKRIISVLKKRGFVLDRQVGSHMIYINQVGQRTTVPSHAGKILHPKTLKSILHDTDISVEDLRDVL
jgi:predicted RNA binding protein YcfA (HicA-like mRNA interferase family)